MKVEITVNSSDLMISRYACGYDALGQKIRATETFRIDGLDETNTIEWSYDNLNRVVQETFNHYDSANSRTTSWTYDNVGNRQTQYCNGVLTTYTYDANDRLLTETTGEKTITYGYTGTQQTSKTTVENNVTISEVEYSYNLQGRMDGMTGGGNILEFAYDIDGTRISQKDGAIVTNYLNDNRNHTGYSQTIYERKGGEKRTYIIGHDIIAQKDATHGVLYFGYDGHGSTRTLWDSAGALTGPVLSYDAYGNAIGFMPSTALTTLLYCGERFDSELGMLYLRARYYDPNTGRFNRLDPFFGVLNAPQSLHKYTYCHSDPVNGIDPRGKFQGAVMSIYTRGKHDRAVIGTGATTITRINELVKFYHIILLIATLEHDLHFVRNGNPPTTALEFLYDWITGRGNRIVHFDDNTYLVRDMKNHSHVIQYRQEALDEAAKGKFKQNIIKEWHSYSGFHGIPIAIRDILGMNGAWASVLIVGSYGLTISTTKNEQNNSVILEYKITNDMGLASATRIPFLGYLEDDHPLIQDWHFPKTILDNADDGPGKTKTMILEWSEEVPL